jgi:hypothetical protein
LARIAAVSARFDEQAEVRVEDGLLDLHETKVPAMRRGLRKKER